MTALLAAAILAHPVAVDRVEQDADGRALAVIELAVGWTQPVPAGQLTEGQIVPLGTALTQELNR